MTDKERDALYAKCNPLQAMAWLKAQAGDDKAFGRDAACTILAILAAQRAEIAALKPLASPVWPEGGTKP